MADLTLTNLGQTLFEFTFAGIETELRAVQRSKAEQSEGERAALDWWDRNFAHKYPDYRYDVEREEVVRR